MKQYSWIKALILNVVTCGIYSFIMWIKMTSARNKVAEKYGVKRIKGFIPAMLLGIITCGIYEIVWMFKFAKLTVETAKAKGISIPAGNNTFVHFILMSIIPVYSFYVLCTAHNRIVEGE